MSNTKKILIAIIATIFMILGYVSISNAKTYYRPSEYKSSSGNYSITSKRYLGYQQYLANKNTFCLEHHEKLWSDEIEYKVTSIVTLRGHTATGPKKDGEYKNGDPKLKQVSHTDGEGDANINAKLFYVLAGLSDASKTEIQETVWWYMDNWIDKIGRKFYGIDAYTANSDNNGKTDLTEEAKKYAKKLKENAEIRDATDKANIKVTSSDGYIYI